MKIDLTSLEQNFDPYPVYKDMRRNNPVYYDHQRDNWNIFRYEDVKRVLSKYETFSSQFMRDGSHRMEMPFTASMISSDPPRHRKLRDLVNQAFTPRAITNLAPRISEIVNMQIKQIIPGEPFDFIETLAYPLPVIVIAEMMGIPVKDQERFKGWSDIVVQSANFGGTIDPERFNNPAILEMSQYFFQLIEERKDEPGDDLISGLLEANIEGEHLNMIELLGFCALLLVAGNETTTNLLGNAMLTFAEHPEVWEKLKVDPNLITLAIEEVLRFRSPVQSMFRVAKTDVHIAGQIIPEGGRIVAWIGSANHDGEMFTRADEFNIERSPNKHLAFGQGIHYCLGAPLARLESKIALETVLKCFGKVELIPETNLERIPSNLIYGLKQLPLKFLSI
jgi:cytochrome P450